jgi:hypothetical protein
MTWGMCGSRSGNISIEHAQASWQMQSASPSSHHVNITPGKRRLMTAVRVSERTIYTTGDAHRDEGRLPARCALFSLWLLQRYITSHGPLLVAVSSVTVAVAAAVVDATAAVVFAVIAVGALWWHMLRCCSRQQPGPWAHPRPCKALN